MIKKFVFAVFILFGQSLWAQSRLPFLTNDTRTLESGKKELSLALSTSSNSSSITFFVPNLNFTYGITNRIQLELQSSVGFYFFGAQDAVIGGTNGILGLKFFLLGNQKDGISLSVAPQQSFPFSWTRDDSRLNPRESITLLPVQLTLRGSDSYILLEAGLEKHSSTFNSQLMAMAFGKYFSPELETRVEYYLRMRENVETEKHSVVTIGGRYDFNPTLQFLFSVGGTTAIFFGEESTYFSYFGVKWIWGGSTPTSVPAVKPPSTPTPAAPVAAPVGQTPARSQSPSQSMAPAQSPASASGTQAPARRPANQSAPAAKKPIRNK